jgi:hypothetical protein
MTAYARWVLALALAALLPVSSVLAELPGGLYVGVGGGNGEADMTAAQIDQAIRDALRIRNGVYTPQDSTIETKNSHLYAFVGYRLSRYLSGEVGYIELGGFEYASRGLLTDQAQNTEATTVSMRVESHGLSTNALGTFELNDYFEIHARGGLFLVNVTTDVRGGTVALPANESHRNSKLSAQFGLGATVSIGKQISLSGDWVRFLDLNNKTEGTVFTYEYEAFDMTVVRISAIARF